MQELLRERELKDEMDHFLNTTTPPRGPKRVRNVDTRSNNPSPSPSSSSQNNNQNNNFNNNNNNNNNYNNNNNNNNNNSAFTIKNNNFNNNNNNDNDENGFVKRKPSFVGDKRGSDFTSKPGRITQVLLVDTNVNEMNIRRSNIVNEMFDTEKSYVYSLRTLIEVCFFYFILLIFSLWFII